MCGIIICIAPASPFLGDNATSKFNQPRKQTQADNKYQPLLIANEFSQTKTIKKTWLISIVFLNYLLVGYQLLQTNHFPKNHRPFHRLSRVMDHHSLNLTAVLWQSCHHRRFWGSRGEGNKWGDTTLFNGSCS